MPYEISELSGTPYRPSKGGEGHRFMQRYCRQCKRDQDYHDPCEILMRTMCFGIEDDAYPEEWTHDEDGCPTCTAHEPCDYQPLQVPQDTSATVDVTNENEQTTD